MADTKINIDKLLESWFEINSKDEFNLDESLKDRGYDPKKIETEGVQKIRKMIFEQTVANKKAKAIELYKKALALIQSTPQLSREAIFSLLKQKSPSLQFRSLENLDDENLQEILNDTEVLELIEKLENGEI